MDRLAHARSSRVEGWSAQKSRCKHDASYVYLNHGFEYTYILWAVLFGFLFWSEIPSLYTLAGVMLLISGNLYILHRVLLNRRKRRKQQHVVANSPVLQETG